MELRFPLPVIGREAVAAAAPEPRRGFWCGAPSAALDSDGTFVVVYRIRSPNQRGAALGVARSNDGQQLTTLATLEKERFHAESLERPALIRLEDGWRLYVSCATPGSKHWRIDALDAPDPSRLGDARPRTVFPGSDALGVKDPVIRRNGGRWSAWICCHPLDQQGEEDRMTTAYATSADGLSWRWLGLALSGRQGMWDARGTRVTAVLADGRASYDGRASKEENFHERTGLAQPGARLGELVAVGDSPAAAVRYLDVVPLPQGGYQLFFEMSRANGSHDLCSQRIAADDLRSKHPS